MQAHRIDTTIQPGGTLTVQGLPVPDGARVEVIVLVKSEPARSAHPLRGTPYRFDEPLEPAVPVDEWESAR
jgi:hypothetical protein